MTMITNVFAITADVLYSYESLSLYLESESQAFCRAEKHKQEKRCHGINSYRKFL